MKNNTRNGECRTHIGIPVEVFRNPHFPYWQQLYFLMLRWQFGSTKLTGGLVKMSIASMHERFEALTGKEISERKLRELRGILIDRKLIREVDEGWEIIRNHNEEIFAALGDGYGPTDDQKSVKEDSAEPSPKTVSKTPPASKRKKLVL